MKNFRGFALGLVLGLSVALAGVGFAQNLPQNEAGKTVETCYCMSSGGDSCAMMKDGAKNRSDKHECCCCGGDSCNMKDMNMKHVKQKQ